LEQVFCYGKDREQSRFMIGLGREKGIGTQSGYYNDEKNSHPSFLRMGIVVDGGQLFGDKLYCVEINTDFYLIIHLLNDIT
jgi:hypothetical protein